MRRALHWKNYKANSGSHPDPRRNNLDHHFQNSKIPTFSLPAIHLMKKLLVTILLLAAVAPFRVQSQQSSGTLAGFLSKQGLAGARLERRFGNHLFVPVSINDRRAALMID